MITFPSSFIFFITCWQYSITISYAMLTNNILISFDHPLCNLKHIAFLIIPLHNVSKSFPLCFLHLAWQAVFFASRYFSLHMFPCFHSFHSFCFSLTHSVSLNTDPPSKPQQSIFFMFLRNPPKHTKILDNSNMLLVFNNNTYNDSRTVIKHILILSDVIQVIYLDQNVTKGNS